MGSLSASGIPVATKDSYTYRKQDIRILQTDSRDDSESVLVAQNPALYRAIESGSIVRKDYVTASVDYYETLVWGMQFESRSSADRIARDGTRSLSVPDTSVVVIETSLQSHNAQKSAKNTGNKVVRRNSVGDDLIDRV